MSNLNQLKSIIKDPTRVIFSLDIDKKYLSDQLGRKHGDASALVFVESTQEVSSE